MENTTNTISQARKKRLYTQGYYAYSDRELYEYKYGLRFAYSLCTSLVALGLILGNSILLTGTAVIAFAAMFPPYHPFDYLYNYAIRYLVRKPKIPSRTNQGRFACGIAFIWLTCIIYLLHNGQLMVSYILGASLIVVGTLVSAMDVCIPSMIYNFLFKKSKAKIIS
jgi:hypothetical protein